MQRGAFIQAEQFLHNMARILGTMGQAYLPAKIDYSHTNMGWDNQSLQTRPIPVPGDASIQLAFHPHELHFNIACIHTKQNDIVIAKNNSLQFVIEKIAGTLSAYGLNGDAFQHHLEYRFPQWNNVDGLLFHPAAKQLDDFARVRSYVNEHLKEFLTHNNLQSEIRIWASNFDTGIYCEHGNGIEQYAGYAPADEEVCPQPYFYNSFYLKGAKVIPQHYPALPHTTWETQKWGGAILPAGKFDKWEDFLDAVPGFLQQATDVFLSRIKQ